MPRPSSAVNPSDHVTTGADWSVGWWEMTDSTHWRVAIEEGRADWGRAAEAVAGARSLAVLLFAGGAIATGFLASGVLTRDTIPATAWVALGVFVAFAFSTMVVIWPVPLIGVRTAVDLTAGNVQGAVEGQMSAVTYLEAATRIRERWLLAGMALLTLDLIMWILALVESTT